MDTAGGKGRNGGPRRESLGSALAQIGVVAALLAGGVTYGVHRGQVRQETETHLRMARAAAQRDNPADLAVAMQQLDALFALNADMRDAQALAADVQAELWLEHRQPGADARAREHLERAEALGARSGERYGARAQLLLAEGKTAEAERLLEELRTQGANSPRLTLAQARVLQLKGDLAGARQAYARAADASWKDPRFATAYGEALLDEGQYTQAVEAFSRATTANPDHLLSRVTAALARLYAGQPRESAEPTLADVRGRGRELTPTLQARAEALQAELALAKGAMEEALGAADQAIRARADERFALFTRARVLAARKSPEARAAFEAAVAARRTAPLPYVEGARALQSAGDGAGALALLDAYATTFKDVKVTLADGKPVAALSRDDRYWLARGGVLEAAGKQDDALAAYEQALAVRGVGMARAQYAKGALLLARKDYAGARPLLAAVAPETGAGTLPAAYAAMGDLLFAQGDFAAGCQHHYFGLVRARAQGTPRAQLASRIEAVRQRLEAAGQANMAKAWVTQTAATLQ
ncbi:tetratricopeptide repeat protein [Corallococcus sp. M34]|uniref:tetratricopeptide repeat protein n=1 Tax=Citreicoccus inhibens TaxID=2849499 RepID=UPI001C2384D5|nr:tetratricopeptide repeat protein [Citreicoccus inhibens]MBU8894930.1 tetratricopeptide repeat protein [Citreicoccus inhibens]